ncbi:MAG TPA: hypothetical protein VJM83_05685 [Nitrospirota bacterium]|nr:hypothetical protein [Nitrospirota bacterium]
MRYPLNGDKALLFAPLVGLGVTLLISPDNARTRLPGYLVLAVLTANLALGMGALGRYRLKYAPLLSAQPAVPMRRQDMPELRNFVCSLRELTVKGGRAEPVYLISASYALNADTIKNAEYKFFGRENALLAIEKIPVVDRRDNFPVYPVYAEWIIIASPPQLQLDPEEQSSVTFPFNEFESMGALAHDFMPAGRPVEIEPEKKCKIKLQVFKRFRPTSISVALDYIERARKFIKHPPVYDNLWVGGDLAERRKEQGEKYNLELGEVVDVLLLRPVVAGEKISGTIGPDAMRPGGGRIEFIFYDYGDVKKDVKRVVHQYEINLKPGEKTDFRIDCPSSPTFLRISYRPAGTAPPGRASIDISFEKSDGIR